MKKHWWIGLLMVLWQSLLAQRIIWLGTPTPGNYFSVHGVSADGRVVVGAGPSRWTPEEGWHWIGGAGWALDVSDDGRVVVGLVYRSAQGDPIGFRWTQERGMELLETPGWWSQANAVSADGSVIVGEIMFSWFDTRPVRWTPNGLEILGGGPFQGGIAYGVSADGSVVVGGMYRRPGVFVWTEKAGLQMLPVPNKGEAYDVSADGQVIVGMYYNGSYRNEDGTVTFYDPRPFRWVMGDGFEALPVREPPPPQSMESWATAVSADGRVIVGLIRDQTYKAVRWVDGRLEVLNEVYADLLGDRRLLDANDISADGRWILGPEYLLDTWREGDIDGDGCVNDVDLLRVLFAFGTSGTSHGRYEDFNWDGVVDGVDLLVVLEHFGEGC